MPKETSRPLDVLDSPTSKKETGIINQRGVTLGNPGLPRYVLTYSLMEALHRIT